jgi:hypothetical protein
MSEKQVTEGITDVEEGHPAKLRREEQSRLADCSCECE